MPKEEMMDWKDLGKKAAKAAPLLATLLGSPAAGAAVSLITSALGLSPSTSPKEIASIIDKNPDALVKLKQIEADMKVELMKLLIQAKTIEMQQVQAVNTTMQAEAKSEHWPQYSWRPFNGFAYPLTVIGIYILLPILHVPVPQVPELIWIGWLSILGVTAYQRAREKRIRAGEQPSGTGKTLVDALRGTT